MAPYQNEIRPLEYTFEGRIAAELEMMDLHADEDADEAERIRDLEEREQTENQRQWAELRELLDFLQLEEEGEEPRVYEITVDDGEPFDANRTELREVLARLQREREQEREAARRAREERPVLTATRRRSRPNRQGNNNHYALGMAAIIVACFLFKRAQAFSSPNDIKAKTERDGMNQRAMRQAQEHQRLLDNEKQHSFEVMEAYDCAEPRNIMAVTAAAIVGCSKIHEAVHIENASFTLLQQEAGYRFTGLRCELTRTQTAFYCGNSDHATPDPTNSYTMVPQTLTEGACRQIAEQGTYRDEMNNVHKGIEKNAVNHIRYMLKGTTAARSNIMGTDITCQGESMRVGGEIVYGMVVSVELQLVVETEKFFQSEGKLLAQSRGVVLPCEMQAGGCLTPRAEYWWTPVYEACLLAVARPVLDGQVIIGADGERVFLSTDGTLVRLIITGSANICHTPLYRTNYEDFYLANTAIARHIKRLVHPAEFAIASFAAGLNDYLYNRVTAELRREFNQVLANDCEQRRSYERTLFWQQWKEPGMTTYILGNGTFASSAGEVLYQYQCQPVVVKAVRAASCYQALPVVGITMESPTLKEVRRLRQEQTTASAATTALPLTGEQPKEPTETPLLFVEPLTRRLTRHGIPASCSKMFEAKYQNARGQWIGADPEIEVTIAPEQPEIVMAQHAASVGKIDWSVGGLYSPHEVNAMERYLEIGRAREEIGTILHTQAERSPGGAAIGPGQLFPDSGIGALESAYPTFFAFMAQWGGICSSVMLGIYTFIFLKWLTSVSLKIHWTRKTYGWGRQLCWVTMPSVQIARRHYRDKKHRRQGAPGTYAEFQDTVSYEARRGRRASESEVLWSPLVSRGRSRERFDQEMKPMLLPDRPPRYDHPPPARPVALMPHLYPSLSRPTCPVSPTPPVPPPRPTSAHTDPDAAGYVRLPAFQPIYRSPAPRARVETPHTTLGRLHDSLPTGPAYQGTRALLHSLSQRTSNTAVIPPNQ